jgi:hypothetical protein
MELPEWHDLVKTGTHKEMCPMDPDWYFVFCLLSASPSAFFSLVFIDAPSKFPLPLSLSRTFLSLPSFL